MERLFGKERMLNDVPQLTISLIIFYNPVPVSLSHGAIGWFEIVTFPGIQQ